MAENKKYVITLGISKVHLARVEQIVLDRVLQALRKESEPIRMMQLCKKVGGHHLSCSRAVMMLAGMSELSVNGKVVASKPLVAIECMRKALPGAKVKYRDSRLVRLNRS